MHEAATLPLIQTIPDCCRTCYQCVRECPAKAIRIIDGQAEVIPDRCIGCGNCVRECHQHAKVPIGAADEIRQLLASKSRVAAIIAPSFPAEFPDLEYPLLVGMLRQLDFDLVNEVGFGADLVALEYRKLLDQENGRKYIATTCPGILSYVEKYHPNLVPFLAPIVSPMVAAARVLRELHGEELKIVFVGPCLAKRREAQSNSLNGEVTQAITFAELRMLFEKAEILPQNAAPSEFDPPHAGMGAIFPIKRGLLQASSIGEDLVVNNVISAGGSTSFVEAIKEFEADNMDVRLLEVLCCNGCIMGAGMTSECTLFSRRAKISHFVKQRIDLLDLDQWKSDMEQFAPLDLARTFTSQDQRTPMPSKEELASILQRMGKFRPEDELNCGACGYETCIEHAIAVHMGLAESEMCLPYSIEQLHRTVEELNVSHQELASAQEALMQSEKLASMGQLAAGIAHEINNPLGVVLMYAHLLLEEAGANQDLREDLQMVVDEADRCKKIVAGLLDFARQNRVVRAPTDVRLLIDRTLRALPPPADIEIESDYHTSDTDAELDRDQIIQVLTNLLTNAYTAMPEGGRLAVVVEGDEHQLSIHIADSGIGIPPENREKIFHPFFTTKQIGKGTGLGLAVTYGIVKMHRGSIECTSNADPLEGPTGTTFTVVLPRKDELFPNEDFAEIGPG